MNNDIKEILDGLNAVIKQEGSLELDFKECKKILYYITNLQEENERLLKKSYSDDVRITKAIEYITSYESISTIQGLDKIEQNKTLDEKTMNIMVYRYLEVHDKLLKILTGGDE